MADDIGRVDVFISHSSAEGDLANYFEQWLRLVAPGKKVFCSSRPRDLPPGEEWRSLIQQRARSADVCLLMLSPDSIEHAWLQFEAGLFLGQGVQLAKLVPVLYGGVQPTMIPTTVSAHQALLLDSEDSFNAFVSARLLEGRVPSAAESHAGFIGGATGRVMRLLRFGEFGLLAPDAIEAESFGAQILRAGSKPHLFESETSGRRLVAIRATVVPRRIGPMIHWKCGFHVGRNLTAGPSEATFRFHSGCHEGLRSWSVYPEARPRLPVNVPWKLDAELPHTLQLWLTPNGKLASCVGIDYDGNRVVLKNDVGSPGWRLLDPEWTQVSFAAWGDRRPFQVDVESLQIDRTLVQAGAL